MSLHLVPATIADRAVLARIIAEANFPDPYGQTVWPGSTIPGRIAGGYARLARTMLGEGAWFMKAVDPSNGEVVAYAQWTLPDAAWKRVCAENGGSIGADVSDEERKQYMKEAADSESEDGEWPHGMRREVVEYAAPPMRAAYRRAWVGDEPHIMLNQVKVLPAHQGKGAGTMLVQWGVELADREGLNTRLEATPFGLPLYQKFGFVSKEEVHLDVSKFGGPEKYTFVMMVREPNTGGATSHRGP